MVKEEKLKLGKIALGIEHFVKGVRKSELTREENTTQILKTALDLGITHFDLVFNMPYFFDTFGEVMDKQRSKITFSAHFGTIYSEKTKKVSYSRAVNSIKNTFEGLLERVGTDYTDINVKISINYL